jgi:CHAT domain-containing protein
MRVALEDTRGVALLKAVTVSKSAKHVEQALGCFTRALAGLADDVEPPVRASVHHHLATALLQRSRGDRSQDLEAAIQHLKQAMDQLKDQPKSKEWAFVVRGLGDAYHQRIAGQRSKNIERAIQCLTAACRVLDPLNVPDAYAECLNALGDAYCDRVVGDRAENQEQAIRCFRKALKVIPDRESLAWGLTHNNLASIYDDRIRGDRQGNCDQAIAYYHEALRVLNRERFTAQWSMIQHNLGTAYSRRSSDDLNDLEQAIRCYELSLEARSRAERPVEWAMTQEALGCAFRQRSRGRPAENRRRAVEHLENARSVHSRETMPVAWAQTTENLALVYGDRRQGDTADADWPRAQADFLAAAEMFQRLDMQREAARCYRELGVRHMDRCAWQDALTSLTSAAEAVERELLTTLSEASRVAWLRESAEVYHGLVAAHLALAEAEGTLVCHATEPDSHVAAAARWAERGRARNLAYLVSQSDRLPAGTSAADRETFHEVSRKLRDCDQRLEAIERHLALEHDQSIRQRLNEQLASLRTQRQKYFRQANALRASFLEADTESSETAQQLTADDTRQLAHDAMSALVTIVSTPWGTCAIVELPDGRIAGKRWRELDWDWLNRLLASQDGPGGERGWILSYHERRTSETVDERQRAELAWLETIDRTLHRLGEQLWRPLSQWLAEFWPTLDPRDPPRVVLLPGPGLSVLPLHAAWWEQNGKRRWACDLYQITYVPSLWMLRRCLQQPAVPRSLSLLAVRNPTGHDPDRTLPWAEREVDAVAQRFTHVCTLGRPGDEHFPPATVERLESELPRHAVALLATHGVYDVLDPWSGSGIYTADHQPGRNVARPDLSLARLCGLQLDGVWLAFLSMCESALSDHRDLAGDQLGLPTALLTAGAATCIGSLWGVNDLATALLSQRFFQELIDEHGKPRASKGTALWRAQKWLRELSDEELPSHAQCLYQDIRDMVTTRVASEPRSSGTTPFAHPFYWSAFVCYGAS